MAEEGGGRPHGMTKKAESVVAPRFFPGGYDRKGRKCHTMKRYLEVATIMEVGYDGKGRKCHTMKRKGRDSGEVDEGGGGGGGGGGRGRWTVRER